MGNLWAESCLRSNNLEDGNEKKLGLNDAQYTAAVDAGSYSADRFANDKAGYGLAQWTWHARKRKLLSFAKAKGKSVGDFDMQLEFLKTELVNEFPEVWAVLKSSRSVRAASDAVLTKFEVPYDMSEAVKKARAGYGEEFRAAYADEGGGNISVPAVDWKQPVRTAEELARRCEAVAKGFKTLYVHGCFGAAMREGVKGYYLSNTSYNAQPDRQAMIRAASADTFGFDCVCLIKGILWGWAGDASLANGGAVYRSRGVPDINADAMINQCAAVSRDFSKIEVGEALWMQGHIGIYIGGGLAVECTPAWANKVQITSVNRTIAGYNRRDWTCHGRLPYVSYAGAVQDRISAGGTRKFTVGETVMYSGGEQYYTSVSAQPSSIKARAGKARITVIATGAAAKHPYHIVGIPGGSNVYGWVDTEDIQAQGGAER